MRRGDDSPLAPAFTNETTGAGGVGETTASVGVLSRGFQVFIKFNRDIKIILTRQTATLVSISGDGLLNALTFSRSEERRVGKEWMSRRPRAMVHRSAIVV